MHWLKFNVSVYVSPWGPPTDGEGHIDFSVVSPVTVQLERKFVNIFSYPLVLTFVLAHWDGSD